MAEPRRNLITQDSTLEAGCSSRDNAFYGAQLLGSHVGRAFRVPHEDLLNVGNNWIYTEVGSGGTAGVTQVADDTNGPVLKFATGASQHNNQQIQWAKALTAGSTTLSAFGAFSCRTGYNLHFHSRIYVSSTFANAAFFAGLVVADTTVLASSAVGFTDGIGIFKAAGASAFTGVQRASSTSTSTAMTTGTINTWYDLDMLIIPGQSVAYYLNGKAYGESTITNMPAAATALVPTFVISAGTAAIATGLVQSLVCIQEAI